ncbi:MAG: hypothetical protein WC269_01835 [Candidatus Gracilibacteria bacterium]|jgi:hypothetical protein
MGNTIRVRDIPEGITVKDIRGAEGRLTELSIIDVRLNEGVLEVNNVPDCAIETICEEIGNTIGRTLDSEDPEIVSFDGVLREFDHVIIDSPDNGTWEGTITLLTDNIVNIRAKNLGLLSAKVPLWAIVRNETNDKWIVHITDTVSEGENGMNVIDESKYPPEKLIRILDPINVQMIEGGGGAAKISNISDGIVEIKFNLPFPDVRVPVSGIKRLEGNPGVKWTITIKDFSTRDANGVNIIVGEEPES